MSKVTITNHLEKLITFLDPFLPFINFHMVDFFTKNGYETFIPDKIRDEVDLVGKSTALKGIINDHYESLPNLLSFIQTSRKFTLKNSPEVCLKTEDFEAKLLEWGCDDFLRLKLDIFMSSKKSHEVDVLSFISAAVRNVAKTTHIVDIGDGKGYLSSMLALHHKIPVLGVDASETNTNGAVERARKLSKIWNSISESKLKSRNTSVNLYKQVTRFVDETVDFDDLVSTIFLQKPQGLSLVGLHTCGDLAASSVRIFDTNKDIKTICNVGCCYHFISEAFEDNLTPENAIKSKKGFPMSDFLTNKKFTIGRSGRMVAAQSVERILAKKDGPNIIIFYRALLELLLDEKCPDLPSKDRKVGRFRKEIKDFNDYVRKSLKRLKLNDLEVTDEEIAVLYCKYEARLNEINIFYLLRCMLAPVIESLILLDRLLFLHEKGYQRTFLVQLFEPVVSPRCYGLISIK